MSLLLDDSQIAAILAEPRLLPAGYQTRLTLKLKRGHHEQELDVVGAAGSQFKLILRQSAANVLDFSIILGYIPAGTNQLFRLTRYNGRHTHTNKLEGQKFHDFHIHQATERYQQSGLREDAYADPTSAYSDFHGALSLMIQDLFQVPPNPQGQLFN